MDERDELCDQINALVGDGFVLILPNKQKVVTDIEPMFMVAALAAVVSSVLNGRMTVDEHEVNQDNTKSMN